jgi:DNA-binding winged helix-turn-helix (wHTH) protein
MSWAKLSLKQPRLFDNTKSVRITEFQSRVLWALMCHRYASHEILLDVLWPDPDATPDTWRWCMTKHVSDLRAALRQFGWEIANEQRAGWTLVAPKQIDVKLAA